MAEASRLGLGSCRPQEAAFRLLTGCITALPGLGNIHVRAPRLWNPTCWMFPIINLSHARWNLTGKWTMQRCRRSVQAPHGPGGPAAPSTHTPPIWRAVTCTTSVFTPSHSGFNCRVLVGSHHRTRLRPAASYMPSWIIDIPFLHLQSESVLCVSPVTLYLLSELINTNNDLSPTSPHFSDDTTSLTVLE